MRKPAARTNARDTAAAADAWITDLVGPNEEKWWTLFYAVLERRLDETQTSDAELVAATGLSPGRAHLLGLLGSWVTWRRLSVAELLERGSSEEARKLCAEALARGIREADEAGTVVRFPRCAWLGAPAPAEEPKA